MTERLSSVLWDLASSEREAARSAHDPILREIFTEIAEGTELRAELMELTERRTNR